MSNSRLILGTVQFGLEYGINNVVGKPNLKSVTEILDYAYQNNIIELDTADAYGDAQVVLKDYLLKSHKSFKIMSKFIWDKTKDFNFHLNKSLEILNQNNIEGYYFHRFDDFKNFPYFDQVESAKKMGKLNLLGASLYSIEELKCAINHPSVNLIQLPFNLFDRSPIKQDLLLKARSKNIKIYIRSVFLQGLFFKNINELPENLLPLRSSLIELYKLSKEFKISISDMALGYVKSKNFIDGILIGVDSLEQLKDNLHSFAAVLSSEQVKKIEAIRIENEVLLNPANWKSL